MPSSVTAQELINRIRERSNSQGEDESTPDSEILRYINASIYPWYEEIVQTSWGGEFYRTNATPFVTTSGVSSYSLPTDLKDLLSVDVFFTSGASNICFNAIRYRENQRNYFRNILPMWSTLGPIFYRLNGGNTINFIPTPMAASSIGINYIPQAPQLQSSDDLLNTQHGFEEWIVLDCAIKILTKQAQLDIIPFLVNERAVQKQRIIEAVLNHDMNQAEQVNDVVPYASDDDY